MITKEKLLQVKEDIDQAKTRVSELTGKQQQLMSNLKKTYGCSSVSELKKKVKAMQESLAKLTTKLDTGIEELEKHYEF